MKSIQHGSHFICKVCMEMFLGYCRLAEYALNMFLIFVKVPASTQCPPKVSSNVLDCTSNTCTYVLTMY